jgi:predicted acetyltransferase
MDNKDLVYRKLINVDLDLFIKLRLDFFNDSRKIMDETEKDKIKASLKNYFIRHIEDNEFIGIVCECNGKVISTAYLVIDEWPANRNFPNGKIGTLLNVYTYPEYRRNGVATKVIKKIIEEAKKQDVSIINLSATKDGENVYRKIGFTEPEDKSMRLKLQDI